MPESQTETGLVERTTEEASVEQKAIVDFLTILTTSSSIRNQFFIKLDGDDLRVTLVPSSGEDVVIRFEVQTGISAKSWGCVRSMKVKCSNVKLISLRTPNILKQVDPDALLGKLSGAELLEVVNTEMRELEIARRRIQLVGSPIPNTRRAIADVGVFGGDARTGNGLFASEDGRIHPAFPQYRN